MPQRRICFSGISFFLFLLFLLALLLTNAELAAQGVRQGLALCTETLFPSLFPFLVLSNLLIGMGAGQLLGGILAKPLCTLLGLSRAGCSAYLLGLLCGIPVGTVTAVSLFERGEISKEELQRLQLFCNQASSGFLVSAVGGAMLGSVYMGAVLYVIVLLSSLTLGIALRLIYGRVPDRRQQAPTAPRSDLTLSLFTQSVRRAFSSMLQICAFVLFFSCIAACVAAIAQALSLPALPSVLLHGILEMTTGISTAATALPFTVAFRSIAFLAAFSGLSVCLQLFAVAEGSGMRVLPYLAAKLMQGGIALLFATVFLLVSNGTPAEKSEVAAFLEQGPRFTVQVLLILFLFSCVTKRKKAPLGRL